MKAVLVALLALLVLASAVDRTPLSFSEQEELEAEAVADHLEAQAVMAEADATQAGLPFRSWAKRVAAPRSQHTHPSPVLTNKRVNKFAKVGAPRTQNTAPKNRIHVKTAAYHPPAPRFTTQLHRRYASA